MDDVAVLHEEIFGTILDLNMYEQGLIFKRMDERLIGYILFQSVDDFADLHYIAVAPAFRRLGYGYELMDIFLEHLELSGIKAVTLEVRRDHVVAIKLYEALGFECIHIRQSYYKDGCDGLLMRLNL